VPSSSCQPPSSPDLLNIFESFIPQLLRYPNPADPLNAEAATLLLRQPEQYNDKVKDYVRRFASSPSSKDDDEEESGSGSGSENGEESDGEMSDMGAVSEEDGLEGMEA
jgi:ubiquitin-conjugating enzyme E2 H